MLLLLLLRVLAFASVIAVATSDYQTHPTHDRRDEGPSSQAEVEVIHGAKRSQVSEHLLILRRIEETSDSFNVPHIYSETKKYGNEQRDSPGLSKPGPELIGNPEDDASRNLFVTADASHGSSSSSQKAYGPQQNQLPAERLREQPLLYQTEPTAGDQRHKRQSPPKESFGTRWTMNKDLSYKVIPPASWAEAQQQCNSMNAFLAVINIKSEEDSMYDFLNSLEISRVWIGLNDRGVKNQWVWGSGQGATYVNWIHGEPSNARDGENCAGIYAHKRAGFSVFNCSLRLPGLCQRRGSDCGDIVIGSGSIRSPGLPANYASNPKCPFTVQAAPGAAGIFLEIQRAWAATGFNLVRISSKLGVQLALSGEQQLQNITVDSPATIIFDTDSSSTAAAFTINFSSVVSLKEYCGTGWTMKRGSCYRLTPSAVSWSNAQNECNSMNGFLTDIGNAIEAIDIYEFLDMNGVINAWIGFNYWNAEEQWAWASGRAVTYANRHGLQPHQAGNVKDCPRLSALFREGIRSVLCDTDARGVCKSLVVGRTCGGSITGSGIVQSPGFPENYPSNIDCSWNIQAVSGASGILMQVLYLSTETCCDHVQISSTIGFHLSLSGVQKPFNITLGTSATIFFSTDYSGESMGFTLEFTSV